MLRKKLEKAEKEAAEILAAADPGAARMLAAIKQYQAPLLCFRNI